MVSRDFAFGQNVLSSTTDSVTVADASLFETGQFARVTLRCGDLPGCVTPTSPANTPIARTVQISGVTGNTITFWNADDYEPLAAAPVPGSAFESAMYFPGNGTWFDGAPGLTAGFYVADFYGNRIVVFNADGSFQKVIGRFGSPLRQDDTTLYPVPDGQGGTVDVLLYYPSVTGTCYDVIYNLRPEGDCSHNQWDLLGRFYGPSDVHVAPDGTVYVIDAWNYRIQVLTPDPAGTTVASDGSRYRARAIGGRAAAPSTGTFGSTMHQINPGAGYLSSPFGIAATPTGDIWVADTSNDRVQLFKAVAPNAACPAGSFAAGTSDASGPAYCVSAFGTTGEGLNSRPYEFNLPTDIAVDASGGLGHGRLIVADSDNNRVHVYDPAVPSAGNPLRPSVITILGRSDSEIGSGVPDDGIPDGWPYEEFSDPWAVRVDQTGRLFVADSQNHRLQVFAPTAAGYNWLGTVGAQEQSPPIPNRIGMNFPVGIGTTADGFLFVVDSGRGRIQKLGPAALAIEDAAVGDTSVPATTSTTLSFTVRNSGQVPVDAVVPTISGTGFDVVSIDVVAPVSLPPGPGAAAEQQYVATIIPSVPGPLQVTVSAAGEVGAVPVTTTLVPLPLITVTAAPFPAITLQSVTLDPAVAVVGSTVTVHARVTNTGTVELHEVTVTVQTTGPVSPVSEVVSLPLPLSLGASADVQAYFTTQAEGTATFSASVTACAEDETTACGDPDAVTVQHAAAPISLPIVADLVPPTMTATVVGPAIQPQPCRYLELTPGNWQLVCGPNAVGVAAADQWFRYPRTANQVPDALDPQREPVRVILTAADETGLRRVEYQSNSPSVGAGSFAPAGNATTWTGTIPVSGEGRNLIAFWAGDTSGSGGNWMQRPTPAERANIVLFCARVPAQCVNVNIDPVPPTLNELPPIVIAPDNTQASIAFNTNDSHSTVSRVFIEQSDCPPAQPDCVRIERPVSITQGDLVLTSEGPEVRGDVTVIDYAGHRVQFTLPFQGQGRPVLRLDRTPPEAFNRLDPQAMGAVCAGPSFTYWCTNKVYGSDNLPGLSTAPFAPLSVQPVAWGGDDESAGDPKFAGIAELHTYRFTDAFVPASGPTPVQNPNTVELVEKVRQHGKEARVRVMSYRYATGLSNGPGSEPNWGPAIVPSWAYKKYEWSTNKDGSLKTLNQKFELWKGPDRIQVLATWDARKNQTTIRELGPKPGPRLVYEGLVLLTMTTHNGTLRIDYAGRLADQDTTPPVLELPATVTAAASSAAGVAVTFTVRALDTIDGFTPVSCTPASGSVFPVGSTPVTCTTTDASGHSATGSFRVEVAPFDVDPPVLTLPAPLSLPATSAAGAVATFAAMAVDAIDGSIVPACVPASGSTFAPGTTTVTCTATDASGNTAAGTFTVTVAPYVPPDVTAPLLSLPDPLTVAATAASGAVVTFTATAVDAVDGVVAVQCAPASGTVFTPGATTVTCSATDEAGNVASGSFVVTITYAAPPPPVTPPAAAVNGCSPGYWKNHTPAWQAYAASQATSSVFAQASAYSSVGRATLRQSLDGGGGGGLTGAARVLARAGVAAALNAAHGVVSYPLAQGAVITRVDAALASRDRQAMLTLAGELDGYNNLGCPLN